jgi:hypothetical protein
MRTISTRLAGIALLCLAVTAPCAADSLASSASSAGSASSGSLSDSSGASSPKDKVAQGDYRVVEIAAVAERPGLMRLTMQATTEQGQPFSLDLRLQAVEQHRLAVGDVLSARHRPYGLAFTRSAENAAPIILVLATEWQRELEPQAVTL